jgi:hypothetical protein
MKPTRPAPTATPDDSQDLGPIETLVVAVLRVVDGLPRPIQRVVLFRALKETNNACK